MDEGRKGVMERGGKKETRNEREKGRGVTDGREWGKKQEMREKKGRKGRTCASS